jgi:hypothetical protein
VEKIDLFIYSYKNKNLKLVIDAALENSTFDVRIIVKDQHPIDRSSLFKDDRIVYLHEFWDHIYSPILFKKEFAHKSSADYYGIISDDILLSPGWDVLAIERASGGNIVSGMGSYEVDQKDIFLIDIKRSLPQEGVTNLIDSNFVFGKRDQMSVHTYCDYLKAFGENIADSLQFFLEGLEIVSLPMGTYKELGNKTLLTTYVPFSLQHGYNSLVKKLKDFSEQSHSRRSVGEFVDLHGIDLGRLKEFPNQYDDVSYDPNDFEIEKQNVGGKRFTNKLASIY